MITIASAASYGIEGTTEMAYQIDYSDGTQVRAVVSAGGWIRNEHKTPRGWQLVGKPYIVNKDKKRQGERIIEAVRAELAAQRIRDLEHDDPNDDWDYT